MNCGGDSVKLTNLVATLPILGEKENRVFRWKICGVKKNEGMELREKEEGVRIYKWERVIES